MKLAVLYTTESTKKTSLKRIFYRFIEHYVSSATRAGGGGGGIRAISEFNLYFINSQ